MPGFVEGPEPEFDGPGTAVADVLDPATLNKPAPPVVTAPPKILETIVSDLRAYSQLEPHTLLHADELMAEQVQNPALRNQHYYVADFAVYTLEGTGKKKIPTLWLARHTAQEPNNFVLNHLDDTINSSFEQLTQTHNYRPSLQEAQKVMQASSTLKIDLTQLRLKKHNDEFSYVEISTTNYNQLNPEQRKLAERFYGQRNVFDTAMATLKGADINTTKVFVLNPAYVQREAAAPIGRAAWRNNFLNSANSYASVYNICNCNGLLGVRRRLPAATGGAPQNSGVPSVPSDPQEIKRIYQILLANPTAAVNALDDKTAAQILTLVSTYMSNKKL
ncbi:hypothetical protein HYU21_00615 [Candidatus Woesearchaeota archaeon]|nr:hypothetical protein [Candidatus Woesearchaeota archaeon]